MCAKPPFGLGKGKDFYYLTARLKSLSRSPKFDNALKPFLITTNAAGKSRRGGLKPQILRARLQGCWDLKETRERFKRHQLITKGLETIEGTRSLRSRCLMRPKEGIEKGKGSEG